MESYLNTRFGAKSTWDENFTLNCCFSTWEMKWCHLYFHNFFLHLNNMNFISSFQVFNRVNDNDNETFFFVKVNQFKNS